MLVERLVNIKRLEDTRLRVAYRMRVKKLRCKSWFDLNLKDKDLKEDDISLTFSVCNMKRKLKYQGMGPS